MPAGPKRAVNSAPLPWRPRVEGSAKFAQFCEKFIVVPKGEGNLSPLRLRDWQIELAGSVLDADPTPSVAGWCLPRGQGKSTLVAALGLYELMTGGEGANVIVAAVDERQAGIVFTNARRMVELNEELASRVQVFKDKLIVPSRGASFQCLPASPASLEGLDYSLAIVDEIGVVDPATWQTILLALGKRDRQIAIGIGTPGVREDNVLAGFRVYAQEHPEDTSRVYVEYSAAGFEDHPIDCEHCWKLANPALDDYLHRNGVRAVLPPTTTEAKFRRARLCQFVTGADDPFIEKNTWESLRRPGGIANGSEVVIGLDGSFNADSTALVIGTVSATPHFDLLAIWQNDGTPGWQVPVLDVEQAILDARKRWRVKELVADPFRWQRSLQVLQAQGVKIAEFPWSNPRVTKATVEMHTAAVSGQFTHSGDETLTRHMLAATVIEDDNGIRISKSGSKRRAHKIDAAAAMLMAHSRCIWLATHQKRGRTVSFK